MANCSHYPVVIILYMGFYSGEQQPSKTHVHPESGNLTLLRNWVFVDARMDPSLKPLGEVCMALLTLILNSSL